MDGDDLYGLPLERFVPERGALARKLRSAGRREDASAVAALRKPSIAAWAVNQLARSQSRAMAELFEAGDALREAQSRVLAGRADARALRAATERERAAVDALLDKARGLLSPGGHQPSPASLDRVAETLHAAALGQDAQALVGEGRLVRELRHVGLDAGIGSQTPPTGPESPAATKRKPPPAKSDRAGAVKLAARQRAKAAKAAQAAVTEARRRADRAAKALRDAEQHREQAVKALRHADEALRHADQALAQAQSEAQAASDTHQEAKQRLKAL